MKYSGTVDERGKKTMITGDVADSRRTFDLPKIKAKQLIKQPSIICSLFLLPLYNVYNTGGSLICGEASCLPFSLGSPWFIIVTYQ